MENKGGLKWGRICIPHIFLTNLEDEIILSRVEFVTP
jgi:hypothetical protein